MGRRKNKKKSHWSAYNSTDTPVDTNEDSAPGGPAFFHYHPGSSGMNQSWWFNTFGKQHDPPPEAGGTPFASISSEVKPEVRNEFPLEPKSYDSRYREYRPPQRTPSPAYHPRSRVATPPPPQGPSVEYTATSDDPSCTLTDPASSRKLLVLDLNGTLLHRSPHPSKSAPRYPIPGQEGFQPRLRPVHPRPYLPSFKSYIFHPSTKKWLDVMVWSSAQPHSVQDMVDKCFREEKHNFTAVWARDTLGLPQHLYNRKVQTLKDLNIPWSKLFALDPTFRHNAMSTLLMDDSPRKAELQPYNHLCVKEYSNVIRHRDVLSMQREKAQLKPSATEPEPLSLPPPPPQLPIEIPQSLASPTVHHHHPTPFGLPPAPLDPSPDFQFDQSVGIQPGATLLNPLPFTSNAGGYPGLPGDGGLGQGVIAPQMLFKNPLPSIMGFQNPQTFQQLPQSINPITPPQRIHHSQSHSHPPLTETPAHPTPPTQVNQLPPVKTNAEEAKASPDPPSSISASKKRKRKGKRGSECETSGVDPTHVIEYDETLLAIIGILDEVRFQSNVASWVKANGLWGPHYPQDSLSPNIDPPAHDSFPKSSEDVATLSDSGSVDSGRLGQGKKKRRDAVTAFFEATVMDGPDDSGSAAETIEKQNQGNAFEAPLWFDNSSTVHHWVGRGKKALETLGISIEHGIKQ